MSYTFGKKIVTSWFVASLLIHSYLLPQEEKLHQNKLKTLPGIALPFSLFTPLTSMNWACKNLLSFNLFSLHPLRLTWIEPARIFLVSTPQINYDFLYLDLEYHGKAIHHARWTLPHQFSFSFSLAMDLAHGINLGVSAFFSQINSSFVKVGMERLLCINNGFLNETHLFFNTR